MIIDAPRFLYLFDILNADKLVLTQPAVDYLSRMYGIECEGETDDDDDGVIEG